MTYLIALGFLFNLNLKDEPWRLGFGLLSTCRPGYWVSRMPWVQQQSEAISIRSTRSNDMLRRAVKGDSKRW